MGMGCYFDLETLDDTFVIHSSIYIILLIRGSLSTYLVGFCWLLIAMVVDHFVLGP